MDRSQVATQIEKLLSKLLFEKKGVKISVEPVSDTQHKSGEYPTWRKYIANIHVDPYRYNNVTSDFNEDYYNFMSNAEDVISNNIKYIGIDDFEVLSKFIIDDKEEFIKMMEKIIYDKWEDVEMEYWRRRNQNLQLISEQLKSKELRNILVNLNYSKGKLIKKWKALDGRLTDALNEAKDNVKYLSVVENFTEPLYSGSSWQHLSDCIPNIMNNIKIMINLNLFGESKRCMKKIPLQMMKNH